MAKWNNLVAYTIFKTMIKEFEDATINDNVKRDSFIEGTKYVTK